MRARLLLAAALLSVAAVDTIGAQESDDRVFRRYRRDGVHIRIAKSFHVPSDQIVSWPVVVIGGSATIDGRIEDNLVVIGGNVRVGPTAQIRGELTAIGGDVEVADAAEVTGQIHNVGVWWPDWPGFNFAFGNWLWNMDGTWWALFGLIGTLLRLTLTLMAACFIALVAPRWVRSIEDRAGGAPFASGLLGIITEIGFVPVLVLVTLGLIVSIVGIPLLLAVPFGVCAFVVVWVAGFAGVAAEIGGRLRGRSRHAGVESPVLDVACGVLLLGTLTLVGNVLAVGPGVMTPLAVAFSIGGAIVEYIAWTVGLGAALTAPLRNRWRTTPPPVPIHTPSPVSA
jgi:hypothetical protein